MKYLSVFCWSDRNDVFTGFLVSLSCVFTVGGSVITIAKISLSATDDKNMAQFTHRNREEYNHTRLKFLWLHLKTAENILIFYFNNKLQKFQSLGLVKHGKKFALNVFKIKVVL